jgi:hypothetical protein
MASYCVSGPVDLWTTSLGSAQRASLFQWRVQRHVPGSDKRAAHLERNKGTVANHSPLCLRHTQRYPELRCLDGRCTGRAFQCLGDSFNASFRLCHRLQCANVVFRPCTANNFLLGQMTAPFLGERPSNNAESRLQRMFAKLDRVFH